MCTLDQEDAPITHTSFHCERTLPLSSRSCNPHTHAGGLAATHLPDERELFYSVAATFISGFLLCFSCVSAKAA